MSLALLWQKFTCALNNLTFQTITHAVSLTSSINNVELCYMVERLKNCLRLQFIIFIACFLTVAQTEILLEATAFSLCSISTDSTIYQSAIRSDIMHPPKVIEETCMTQTTTNNPLSRENKWINAAVQKMTWALAWAHWHNNRDIQLRMLMTPLCLASGAALVFCKPGLHWRLAGCKHSTQVRQT